MSGSEARTGETDWLKGRHRAPVRPYEWAKRQATRHGITLTPLANGFAACDRPQRLQALCDQLTATELQRFLDRWLARVPTPLGLADQAAGFWWELSMRQVEVSRTIVFDAPAGHERSSRRWSPTTSHSGGPTRSS